MIRLDETFGLSKPFGLSRTFRVAVAVALFGSVVGCDTVSNLNPFKEKETPLQGERRPVPRVTPPPSEAVPQPLSGLPASYHSNLA